MSEQYLVDVAPPPTMHDKFDVILANWYDQYHHKMTALQKKLRCACTAFFTQLVDRQMWFDYRPGIRMPALDLMREHVQTANRMSRNIINETDQFIQVVNKSACLCQKTRDHARMQRQYIDREEKPWHSTQELWNMARLLMVREFDEAFRARFGTPEAETLEFDDDDVYWYSDYWYSDFIDGTSEEAKECFDHMIRLMLRVKQGHATDCIVEAGNLYDFVHQGPEEAEDM